MRYYLRVCRGVKDTECREVTHCRIRVIEVSLDPDRCLTFLKPVGEHLIPERKIRFHGLVPARAGSLFILELLEELVLAGTDICPAPLR